MGVVTNAPIVKRNSSIAKGESTEGVPRRLPLEEHCRVIGPTTCTLPLCILCRLPAANSKISLDGSSRFREKNLTKEIPRPRYKTKPRGGENYLEEDKRDLQFRKSLVGGDIVVEENRLDYWGEKPAHTGWFVYNWSQRSLKFYEEDRGGIGWIGVRDSIARVPLL